jgi:predicted O-linked N-acetylglucosamine transferase (SPINDLY family)
LHGAGLFEEARKQYEKAISIEPRYAEAQNNLGKLLFEAGETSKAIEHYRRASQASPFPGFHSNLIYAMHFDPDCTPHRIRDEHRLWESRFAVPLRPFKSFTNDRDPTRRLRVGYISPDFYSQAESRFTLPLLESHDHEQFEIFCYASVQNPDAVTVRLRKSVDHWIDALAMPDDALAARIQTDGIDIVVDLTMHMQNNRLLVLARRPAPVQITWLAYPGSTGLTTIDYRLTDRFIDPIGPDESWSAEKPLRLPDCWCAYEPLEPIEPNDLPAIQNGYLTFGSLNNPGKNNQHVLELWARLMNKTPGSRLLLLQPVPGSARYTIEFFASRGIDPARIDCLPRLTLADFWKTHHRMDIALDTFPYNGITTTCDALYMGVPVLTLPGAWPASRVGAGLLTTVGLEEFIAKSDQDFTEAGARWTDLPRLAALRRELRSRMSGSPLCDGKRFARNVESIYRDVWRSWGRA